MGSSLMSNVYLNGPCIFMTPTAIHVQPSTGPIRSIDAKLPIMEVFPVLQIQFFFCFELLIVFAIYPNY